MSKAGMRFAVLFPGQGSQFVGMGEDLFSTGDPLLGSATDEMLGWSLRDVAIDGPEEALTATDKAQVVIYCLSIVLWQRFSAAVGRPPIAAAGHSLGELTALTAAGFFNAGDGLSLVAARGSAMAAAAAEEPSGMAALIGADAETGESIAAARREAGGRIWLANVNAPGQVVLAGSRDDIAWLVDEARALGVRRVIPLKVAGAFHTPFMASASDPIREAAARVPLGTPAFGVWSNTVARPFVSEELPALIGRQVIEPVLFADSVAGMAALGVDVFVHVGPGDVTAAMARRSAPGAEVLVVNDLASVEEVASQLSPTGTMPQSEERRH